MIKRSEGVWMAVVFALFVFITVTVITAPRKPLAPVAAAPVVAATPGCDGKWGTDKWAGCQATPEEMGHQNLLLGEAREKEARRAAEQQQRVFDRCVNLAEGTIAECRRRADR